MLGLAYTGQFKRDYKREKNGQHSEGLDELLKTVTDLLRSGTKLPVANKDHALKGKWTGSRDCHLKPDLVLIYCETETVIELARVGSHSELFG